MTPRRRDEGAMLLLAAFVLAAAGLIALGTLAKVERGEYTMVAEADDPLLDRFLALRGATHGALQAAWGRDPNVTGELLLHDRLGAHFRVALAWSLSFNASLARTGSGAPVIEHDPNGLVQDLTEADETYEDWLCGEVRCYGEVAYDGTPDGLIESEDGRVVAAIVWVRVESTDASLAELLVVDL